jgi:hypothetical protein
MQPTTTGFTQPGAAYLRGGVDCHIHACPHINGRSVTVFSAVRQAAAAGMVGIGLMDNFANSSGYAALAMAELGELGVDVFGGLIMQPAAGGVDAEAARSALRYGYGEGTGARFVSLPTHHTRHVARAEGRSPAYIETCLGIPESGPMPDPIPEIMDLCAEADAVFDCGHVSGPEAVRLAEAARARGLTRVRTHCSRYAPDVVRAIVAAGAYAEFSYFLVSLAGQIGLTHADKEKHAVGAQSLSALAEGVRAAGERAILSSDAGISVLPVPVESFRTFVLAIEASGFSEGEIFRMVRDNPIRLFRVGGTRPGMALRTAAQ